jgi:hypothetical protein
LTLSVAGLPFFAQAFKNIVMADEWLYFDEVNASCGEYAYKPLVIIELAQFITGERTSLDQIDPNAEQGTALRECYVVNTSIAFQLNEGIASSNFAQAG